MKRLVIVLLFLSILPVSAELPYAEHGWNDEEAAAHLLSRLTYGARPGEAQRVAEMGLERWLERQLALQNQETVLEAKLAQLPLAYRLDGEETLKKYPGPPQIRKMAREEGILEEGERPDRGAIRQMLEKKGLRPFQELGNTLFAQKLLHARHGENGLREVLTDFWFNHFNVALSNRRAAPFILSYERDAIRPNALGDFRTLLGATAKHPAMLLYLDNANSSAGKDAPTTAENRMEQMAVRPERKERMKERLGKRKKGLNENYARELMELHTLGVDGGYSQQDVVDVARAFTGWTVLPPKMKERMEKQGRIGQAMGVESEGSFVFASPIHDAGPKRILGRTFPAGGGREEGEQVLDLLSYHPSTAGHIAEKLAVRFICDDPAPEDVRTIAKAFQSSGGDLKSVMRAVVQTDGFWDRDNRSAKVKTPFELVVSASRALDGELYPSRQLYGWLAKMGQPLYNYQAPTGFPDRADFWVSSATVLNRVNFALQAGRGEVLGFVYPPRPGQTVTQITSSLLPYREVSTDLDALMANSKSLDLEPVKKFEIRPNLGGGDNRLVGAKMRLEPSQTDTATMVGLTLGTPEFQRR
jgi:uncharacterized protein (DUF1800 family)